MIDERAMAMRWEALGPELSERERRLFAAGEARSHGRGGIAAAARATGLSRRTIQRGLVELAGGERFEPGRVRRAGAGRPSLAARDATVVEDLERLVGPATRGDPERPLRWTSKSAANLAVGLRARGHRIADRSVLRLLKRIGYTVQANVKTREGADHPDRDAQFEHINDTVAAALAGGQRRHQEEGAGRRVQKRRARVGQERPARASQHARLPQPRQGQ